jgi:hypothetical protein
MFNAPAAPRWPAVTAIAIALAICACSADGGSQSHAAAGSGAGASLGGVGSGTNLGAAAASGSGAVISTGGGMGSAGDTLGTAGNGAATGATPPQGDGDAAVAAGDSASSSPSPGDASATTDGNGGAAPSTGPFVCSELIGLWVASQWWGTFDKTVVDKAHWQFMFQHHGYLELFTDPASPFWKNVIMSPCATQSATPDRIVFLPFSLTLNTLDVWQMQLTKLVDTIKGKFPGVRRIEIMTTLRSPGNMLCPNDKDPGTVVPAYVDQAIQAVADQSGGLVTVGPKIEVKDCAWWGGGTDLTGAGNAGVGQLVADYYTAHP